MASNGLMKTAVTGTCRMCLRARNSKKHLKIVGEVKHGFATGHVWECIDMVDCDRIAMQKIKDNHPKKHLIELAIQQGRFEEYVYCK